MEIESTSLAGVVVLTPRRFGDDRGFFAETWNRHRLAEADIHVDFVQDNQAFSAQAGTFRGLHFQRPPHAQAKLVRVGRGAIVDVVVDLRHASPTYGRHVAVTLSAENRKQIYVPVGFAHGYMTTEPDTEVLYKASDYYAPEAEGGLRFDDPALAIDWPLTGASVSANDRDRSWPLLGEQETVF